MKHGKLIALAAGALFAVGPAAAQSELDWAKVVAGGKQEGKLVVYNAAIGAGYYREVAKSFEQKYGITVETLDVRASELSERVGTEQAAGCFLGAVEMHGQVTLGRQEQAGMLQPHEGIWTVELRRSRMNIRA